MVNNLVLWKDILDTVVVDGVHREISVDECLELYLHAPQPALSKDARKIRQIHNPGNHVTYLVDRNDFSHETMESASLAFLDAYGCILDAKFG